MKVLIVNEKTKRKDKVKPPKEKQSVAEVITKPEEEPVVNAADTLAKTTPKEKEKKKTQKPKRDTKPAVMKQEAPEQSAPVPSDFLDELDDCVLLNGTHDKSYTGLYFILILLQVALAVLLVSQFLVRTNSLFVVG